MLRAPNGETFRGIKHLDKHLQLLDYKV
jgi:hypothetical protein